MLKTKDYKKEELDEAKTALSSTLSKCEKIQEGKKLGASQQTLLDRRIRALRLSLSLIEKELVDTGDSTITLKNGGMLLVVRDLERSRAFYQNVLGLKIINDFGANIVLSGGLSLQTLDSWQEFIGSLPVSFKSNDTEIYFEVDDFDDFVSVLGDVPMTHPPCRHSWGQRVVRFYDPDGHIIEVGENMTIVVRRFITSGLSVSETAAKMDVPESYVKERMA